jgi:hypothetical protein
MMKGLHPWPNQPDNEIDCINLLYVFIGKDIL